MWKVVTARLGPQRVLFELEVAHVLVPEVLPEC